MILPNYFNNINVLQKIYNIHNCYLFFLNTTSLLLLPLLFHSRIVKVLVEAIRQEKETKVIQIDRETVKVLLCSDNTIIHIKTPKDYKKITKSNK